jgi:YD repeat-containing protein
MQTVTVPGFGLQGKGFLVSLHTVLLMAGIALGAPSAYAANTVGTAPGQFSVSPTGAATYQIPIDVPPGVNGLKPSLALLYNSQAGNGLLGQGWSLSGLSVISHCPQTLDQDGVALLPQDSDQTSNPDRLCLDGQRLVLISGTYGQLNSTYRTEIDSFRVVKINQGTSSSGPASFTVVDRAGLTSTYSTLVAGGNGGTGAVPLLWLITSVQDRYGNFINFTYNLTASNSILNIGSWDSIAKIVYGSATGGRVGKIIFSYNTSRPDTVNQYFAHSLVTVNPATLTGITVQDGNNNPLKTYTLSYQYPSSTPGLLANPPTELTSVQECAGTACYPATTFNYGGSAAGFGDGPPQINNTAMPGYMVADFDGDGLPDFIYEDNGVAYVVFGNNIGTPVQVSATMGDVHQGGISLTGAVVVDLKGDGKQELMVPNFPSPGLTPNVPTWYVLAWNGQMGPSSTLSAQPAPTTNNGDLLACNSGESSCAMIATAMDIHRNGQSSLFYEDSGEFYYYTNVNGVFNPTPVPTNLTYMTDVNGVSPQLTPLNWQGQAGVYVAGQNIGYSGVVSWNATSGAFTSSMSGDKALSGKTIPLDANGDGLPDAVSIEGTQWCYISNNGAGFDTSNSSNYSSCATAPGDTDLTKAQVIDWFGNGQQEVIVPLNSRWYLFEPLQSAFVDTNLLVLGTPTEFIDVNDDGYLDMVYTTSDNNVHYLPNLATPYVINQITDGLGHNTDVGYVSLGAETHGAYVQGVAPASVAPPQTRIYTGAMNIVKDFAVDTGTFDNSTPPKEQQIYTYYLYAGAAIEQWGRGFLGFSKIEAINYNTGLYTVDTYSQTFPYAGQVLTSSKTWNSQATLNTASVGSAGVAVRCTMGNPAEPACTVPSGPGSSATTFVTGGVQISTTTNCYADAYDPLGHTANDPSSPCAVNNVGSRVYAGVYSPYTVSSTTQLYDIGPGNPQYETTTTKSTYKIVSQSAGSSASGVPGPLYIGADVMPTDVTVTTSDSTDNETVDTTSDYSAWEPTCPAHPGLVTVTHTLNGSSAPSQTETFTYNANCFLITDLKNIVGPVGSTLSMMQTKSYTSDATYGNPLTSTVSGTNAPVRTTTMVYDATERFPATITNSLNQTENLSYDAWGNKLTDTDANGNTVSYVYDGFERKTSQSGPLPDAGTTWAYTKCGTNCAVGTVFQVTQTGSDGSTATTQYDEIARGVRSSHLGFSGETINQDTAYDLLGRAIQTSVPYKTGAIICSDTKSYDVLNRVTQETQPYGASPTSCGNTRTVGYVYTGLKTVKTLSAAGTSIASEIMTTNLNVLGKPSSIKDEGGPGNTNVITSYIYDPWGNLTSSTPPDGAVVSMTYDSQGDKLTMQDPDMGAWSYTYDGLGELLTQTDAKGQTVTNTYDLLGRLVNRSEAEGITRWAYDIGYGAGIGKLAYTVGPNGVWEGYAYDGFGETTDKITVVNNQEYWVTTTYDDQGRASQVVYPTLNGINVSAMPATPSGLTVAQVLNPDNSTSFNLGWQLNTASQNGQIFHVYRTPSNVTGTITTTVPAQYEIYSGPVPNWQDNTVTVDDTYTWWLQACNDTNCSLYISQSLVVVLPPTVSIFNLPAVVESAMSWSVTWSTASLGQTGNPGPITYVAQISYNGGTWTPLNGTGTSATETSDGDGSYSYRVQACANGACSNFSAPITETIAIQPGVPQSVTVPATVTPQT